MSRCRLLATGRHDHELPTIERFFETAKQLAQELSLAARTRARAWFNDKCGLSANNNLCLFIRVFGAYRPRWHIAPHATRKELLMTVVSTLDVTV